jgi:hypothetical protein
LLNTRENGFAVLIEEVYLSKKIGLSFSETPYILTARKNNTSKSKFNYSLKTYISYAKYLFKKW